MPSVRSAPPEDEGVDDDAAPVAVLVEDPDLWPEALAVDAGALAVGRVDAPPLSPVPVEEAVLVAAAVAAACEDVLLTGADVHAMPRSFPPREPSRPSSPFQRPSSLVQLPSLSPPQRATLEEGAAATRQAAEKATNAEENFMTQNREEKKGESRKRGRRVKEDNPKQRSPKQTKGKGMNVCDVLVGLYMQR